MITRRSRLLKVLLLASSATLVATGIAVGAARHNRHGATRHVHAHAASTDFSALSRDSTAADEENADVVGAAREDEALQPAQARLLDASTSGRTWLIPTSQGELCLGVQPAGQYDALEQQRGLGHLSLALACGPTAAAETSGIAVRVYDEVVGIVPDGVTSVVASIAGGAPTREAVVGNTYRFPVPDDFLEGSIAFQGRDGAEQVDQL